MVLPQFVIDYDCSPNVLTPMWLRGKILKYYFILVKNMKLEMKIDEKLCFSMTFENHQHCNKEICKKNDLNAFDQNVSIYILNKSENATLSLGVKMAEKRFLS